MGEQKEPQRRRMIWVWVAAIAAVAVVVTGAVIAVNVTGTDAGAGAPPPDATAPEESVPPIETDLPTPAPGATEPSETVEPVEVALDESAEPMSGVSIAVSDLESVEGEPRGPGEVAGPALRATVSITNSTDDEVDLRRAVLTLLAGEDESPATEVSGPGGSPFPASVGPGETASGTFVFTVPLAQRDIVRLILDLTSSVASTVFVGPAPE